jgi:uncharacterized protein (UPF0332 family)
MSLAEELLAQSRFLASLDPISPKQANLRRAVSAAYYAVFHLFSAEVAAQISPVVPSGLRERTQRALTHGSMYKAAESFSLAGTRPRNLPADINLPYPVSAELISIAKGFKQLQEERHAADYDVSQIFDRLKVLALVETAENIFVNWRKEKTTANAPVFLSSLMFWQLWNK